MLSVRHLHDDTRQKSRPLELTRIIHSHTLDGLLFSGKSNGASFLKSFEWLDKDFLRKNPEELPLYKYISQKFEEGGLSYTQFTKRYNPTQDYPVAVPIQQLYKCPNCSRLLRSVLNLKRHKEKCPSYSTKATVSHRLILEKVEKAKSIISKSKMPLKTKFTFKVKPSLQLKIKRKLKKLNLEDRNFDHHVKPITLPKKVKVKRPPPVKAFSCSKCTENFISSQTLETHMKFDHRERPTCSICQRIFECRRKRNAHMESCKGTDNDLIKLNLGVVDILAPNKIFTCNKCDNFFVNQGMLREHKLITNKRNPFSIFVIPNMIESTTKPTTGIPEKKKKTDGYKICIKNAPSVKLMCKDKEFTENVCPYCNKEFQSEWRYKQHTGFCNAKKELLYDFTSNTLREKLQHAMYRVKLPSCCSVCEKRFETVNELLKHLLSKHRNTSKKMCEFVCSHCGKAFSKLLRYCKHLETHVESKKCPLCKSRQFKTLKLLKFHVRVAHSKSICSQCKKCYPLKNKIHQCEARSERIERSFLIQISKRVKNRLEKFDTFQNNMTCYICTAQMSNKADLVLHLISQHSDKTPFRCKHCSATFKIPSLLTSHHMDKHCDEINYAGSISLEDLIYKHSVVECDIKHCNEVLFLSTEDLTYHCGEKHDMKNIDRITFSKTGKQPQQILPLKNTDQIPIQIAETNTTAECIDTNNNNNCKLMYKRCTEVKSYENETKNKLQVCKKMFEPQNTPAFDITTYKKTVSSIIKTSLRCKKCDQMFNNRKRLNLHRKRCKGVPTIDDEFDESRQKIKPAHPSLDTILSPDNKFDEKIDVIEEVMTLNELKNFLLPLNLVNDSSPTVHVTDIMSELPFRKINLSTDCDKINELSELEENKSLDFSLTDDINPQTTIDKNNSPSTGSCDEENSLISDKHSELVVTENTPSDSHVHIASRSPKKSSFLLPIELKSSQVTPPDTKSEICIQTSKAKSPQTKQSTFSENEIMTVKTRKRSSSLNPNSTKKHDTKLSNGNPSKKRRPNGPPAAKLSKTPLEYEMGHSEIIRPKRKPSRPRKEVVERRLHRERLSSHDSISMVQVKSNVKSLSDQCKFKLLRNKLLPKIKRGRSKSEASKAKHIVNPFSPNGTIIKRKRARPPRQHSFTPNSAFTPSMIEEDTENPCLTHHGSMMYTGERNTLHSTSHPTHDMEHKANNIPLCDEIYTIKPDVSENFKNTKKKEPTSLKMSTNYQMNDQPSPTLQTKKKKSKRKQINPKTLKDLFKRTKSPSLVCVDTGPNSTRNTIKKQKNVRREGNMHANHTTPMIDLSSHADEVLRPSLQNYHYSQQKMRYFSMPANHQHVYPLQNILPPHNNNKKQPLNGISFTHVPPPQITQTFYNTPPFERSAFDVWNLI